MFILPLLQALGIPPSNIDNIEYDPRIGSLCFCEPCSSHIWPKEPAWIKAKSEAVCWNSG